MITSSGACPKQLRLSECLRSVSGRPWGCKPSVGALSLPPRRQTTCELRPTSKTCGRRESPECAPTTSPRSYANVIAPICTCNIPENHSVTWTKSGRVRFFPHLKMTIIHAIMATLCIIAIIAVALFVLCRTLNMVDYVTAWLHSSKEEKVVLTRFKGHYNANGFLIHSDSDIQLGTSGSFKRFEPVDKDVGVTMELTTSFNGDWPIVEMRENHLNSFTTAAAAPPEVRLVDNVSGPPQEHSRSDNYKISNFETSICPIPRPKSSISVVDSLPRANSEPLPIHTVVRKPISYQSTLLSENSCEEVDEEVIPQTIQKAVSCETICSDTSVGLDDLEDVNITGNLCVGFEFDAEYCELIVNILEAKDLKLPPYVSSEVDTYVKVFCEQDNDACVQTKTYRSAGSPCYKERFLFPLNPREQQQKTLSFQVFVVGELGHYLIGEGEIRLSDVSLRQPITTWVTLTDTGQNQTNFGELMFSLSYLPTAERLTVVVVKARKLKFQNEVGDSFVKVYLMQYGKKIQKKKTSIKKTEMSPIFNEAMMFSVPLHSLQGIQLRLTASEVLKAESGTKTLSIGHVIVGAQATGRSLSHWNQMLIALRKPIAMWHPLRK